MITLHNICKTFKIAQRSKGAGAALKSLFKREYKHVHALNDVLFHIGEGEIVDYMPAYLAHRRPALRKYGELGKLAGLTYNLCK